MASTRGLVRRRALLYARVSQDDRDGLSPTGQLSGMRRWCKDNDREVVDELRDDGISASRFAGGKPRKHWEQAIAYIEAGQVDELHVRAISRASRDRGTWARLVGACIAHNVLIVVDGKAHDPADADDGFMLDLGLALAVRDSAVISKAVRAGQHEAALVGRPAGRVLYGLRRVLDPDTGKTTGRELDPEKYSILREGVERLLAGELPYRVVSDFNRRKLPTPRGDRWHGSHLIAMVTRPAYARVRIRNGMLLDVQGDWPELITPAEQRKLRAMFLSDPDRAKSRGGNKVKHLGSGLFRCGREGCDDGRMRRLPARGAQRARYDCRECHKVSRDQDNVDKLINALMVRRLSSEDVLTDLAAIDSDPATDAAAKELDDLRAELEGWREDAGNGKVTRESFARIEPRLLERIADAEKRARPKGLPPVVWELAGPDAAVKWPAAPIGDRRAVLAAMLEVTIMPAGSTSLGFDPALINHRWRS